MNNIETYINNSKSKLIGITGSAGSGKTVLTATLIENNPNFIHYSADYKFIGDSTFRKDLLKKKFENSLDSYIDMCNQYNWWDWNSIEKDLLDLKSNKEVVLSTKYNRDLGKQEEGIVFKPTLDSKIIFEGALLGNIQILDSLEEIVFIYTDKQKRFNRLVQKDITKRSLNEIIARFLITEYSENKHYQFLFKYYEKKIKVLDENYDFISFDLDLLNDIQYIPVPIIN